MRWPRQKHCALQRQRSPRAGVLAAATQTLHQRYRRSVYIIKSINQTYKERPRLLTRKSLIENVTSHQMQSIPKILPNQCLVLKKRCSRIQIFASGFSRHQACFASSQSSVYENHAGQHAGTSQPPQQSRICTEDSQKTISQE